MKQSFNLLCVLLSFCALSFLPESKPVALKLDITKKYLTFDQFQTLFQKKYAPSEITIRSQAYEANLMKLIAENCSACGVTHFFDKTEQ